MATTAGPRGRRYTTRSRDHGGSRRFQRRIPQLWRVSALARRLGISRQWIYRWIKEGRIQSYRLYGAVLLREVDILKLLREQGIPSEQLSKQRTQS